ncbi:hypothetical protein CsatA_002167 [Cannabis sativa]
MSSSSSSQDYHDHVLNLARMQSTNISTNVPRYGLASPRFFHAPKAVGSQATSEEIREEEYYKNSTNKQQQKKKQQHPQFEDKVEIIGYLITLWYRVNFYAFKLKYCEESNENVFILLNFN